MASGGHCKENFFSALHKIIGVAGAQLPDSHVSELKRTGARSAQARTRGQNPLVFNIQVCGFSFCFPLPVISTADLLSSNGLLSF